MSFVLLHTHLKPQVSKWRHSIRYPEKGEDVPSSSCLNGRSNKWTTRGDNLRGRVRTGWNLNQKYHHTDTYIVQSFQHITEDSGLPWLYFSLFLRCWLIFLVKMVSEAKQIFTRTLATHDWLQFVDSLYTINKPIKIVKVGRTYMFA